MWLSKTTGVPGAAPGGLAWNTPEDVVEVDDELGLELLSIAGAGFAEAPESAVEATPESDPPAADAAPDATEVVEAPTAAPKKRAARKTAATEVSE